MKETGRCGIVLIVPDAREGQLPIGLALAGLVDSDDRATHALLCEGVFICLRRVQAEGRICEIGDGNTRYLLDPAGRRLEADRIDPSALGTPEAFTRSFGPFLHGRSQERLRERADAIRKTLSPEARDAVEKLDADDPDLRESASAHLLREADRILPFLAELSLRAEPVERRGRAADVIEAHFKAAADAPGPRLPFGCKVPKLVPSGCGRMREQEEGEDEKNRMMVACGMARAPRESRRFLGFLKE